MLPMVEMQQVQIFTSERAQWHGEPLYLALLQLLRRQGAAGATVVRGLAGFGAQHHLHRATLVELGADLPLIVIWVDRAERVARLLPQIQAMLGDGLITVAPVTAYQPAPPMLAGLPADLRVREVMTREVVTARPDTPLGVLADLLLQGGVRSIPIVDDARRVVGIVTDGDLLRRGQIALPLSIREALTAAEVAAAVPPSAGRAAEIMTRDVVCASEDLPLPALVELLARHGFKRLPVVDRDGRLVGIVSRADVLQTVAHVAPSAAPQLLTGRAQRVAEVMQREVATVRPDTPLAAVVEALAQIEQRRVVVVDAQRHVLGIITDGDLIRRATAEERPGIVQRMLERLRGQAGGAQRQLVVSGRCAAEVMTAPVITIDADATPHEAIRLMWRHRVKRLPVVDHQGRLVGLIGRAGALRALAQEQPSAGPPA